MRNLLVLLLAGSLSLGASLIAFGENPSPQTNKNSTINNPSAGEDTQSEGDVVPPPTVDLGYEIDGCTYTHDKQLLEDMGFYSYRCFNKVMHGVNVAAGGKCQSFALNDQNRKFLCFNDIARGGRSLQMDCATAWHYVVDDKGNAHNKGDVECKDPAADPKKNKK